MLTKSPNQFCQGDLHDVHEMSTLRNSVNKNGIKVK